MRNKSKMTDYIVDVHSHFLPGIDDGSGSMDETVAMLAIAKNEGITHMIATPHFKPGRHNANPIKVRDLLSTVKEEAVKQNILISLYQGNEIFFSGDLEEVLEAGKAGTMCGGEYLLVEFSPKDQYRYIRNAVDEIKGAGYQPIVAHVERYECMLKEPGNVENLKALGAEIQINASSITGETGRKIKRFVHGLLKKRLVDYVGTDAHGAKRRSPRMMKCCKVLYRKYDSDYIDAILYGNAMERLLKEGKVFEK